MTSNRPRPVPSAETAPFWDGLAREELRLRCCPGCGRFGHPRELRCPDCAAELGWRGVSGSATLASWTVVHRPFVPGFTPPYVVAQVRPVEAPHVFLDSVIEADPASLSIGMVLEVVFRADARGFSTHCFRPVRGSAATSSDVLDSPQEQA